MARGMSKQVGYMRVSSVDQNLARQLDGVELDRVFEDKCSGRTKDRPGLAQCLDYLRDDDVLHVHSIDRLARNLLDLQQLVTELNERRVTVIFHKEGLTFSGDGQSPMQTLQLQLMGAIAEFERALIRERQEEGLAKAQAEGKRLGPPLKLTEEARAQIVQERRAGETAAALATRYGVARSSIYRVLEEDAA